MTRIPDGVKKLPLIAVAAAVVLATSGGRATGDPGLVTWIAVSNGGTWFQGDNRLLTTVSPNGDGFRDRAVVHFALSRAANVTVAVYTTRVKLVDRVWARSGRFSPGLHKVVWRPAKSTPRQSYLVRLTASAGGLRAVYGSGTSWGSEGLPGPVVRVQGVAAHFTKRSYPPGSLARLVVGTDATQLTIQVFRAGLEGRRSYSPREMRGAQVTDPVAYRWRHRSAAGSLWLRIGELPSGLYFARVVADDGRVGFAPFVVAPKRIGEARVAVVLPTNTWAAYNFWDGDGNGYGDSWYAQSGARTVVLSRAFLDDGVPPFFSNYDLGFIRWLWAQGLQPDFLSDDDLAGVRRATTLTRAYDLIVFPGHEEYATEHTYDAVQRFRDLGGNLMFLSANNFFWKVQRDGNKLTRVKLWRNLGRPEAGLVGVQYAGSNHGAIEKPFVVEGVDTAPWAFAGTGFANGSSFGSYGIEIDARGPATPPSTIVLARVPNALGTGQDAEMTYYETPQGAKVFAAGTLDFAASLDRPDVSRLVDNVWARLASP